MLLPVTLYSISQTHLITLHLSYIYFTVFTVMYNFSISRWNRCFRTKEQHLCNDSAKHFVFVCRDMVARCGAWKQTEHLRHNFIQYYGIFMWELSTVLRKTVFMCETDSQWSESQLIEHSHLHTEGLLFSQASSICKVNMPVNLHFHTCSSDTCTIPHATFPEALNVCVFGNQIHWPWESWMTEKSSHRFREWILLWQVMALMTGCLFTSRM